MKIEIVERSQPPAGERVYRASWENGKTEKD